jgi:O-antigen/teichoic acid export membrane protein
MRTCVSSAREESSPRLLFGILMLKKTAWLLFGQGVSDGLALLFYVTIARTFGDSGIGDYSFAFSLAMLFGIGIQFGLRPLITRNIARDPTLVDQYCGAFLAVQVALIIVLGAALHILYLVQGYSSQMYFLLLFAFMSIALKAVGLSFTAFLEAMEAMKKSAMLEVLARITIVLVGFALIFAGAELQTIMIAHVIGGAVYLSMAVHWMRQHFKLSTLKLDLSFMKKMAYEALPFVGTASLWQLYSSIDIIMLHAFVGDQVTGRYAVAFRILRAPLIVPFLIGIAMYPTLSRHSALDATERNDLFLSTLKWSGVLGVAGATILFSVGDKVVTMLFGEAFVSSGELMRLMGLLLFIGFIKVPYDRLLLASNRENMKLRFQGIAVGLNIALNIFLIPAWEAYGALWASIISELYLVGALHLSCARLVSAPYAAMGEKLLLAGTTAAAVGILTRGLVPWPLTAGLTLAALAGAGIALRVVTLADYRQFALVVRGLRKTPLSI